MSVLSRTFWTRCGRKSFNLHGGCVDCTKFEVKNNCFGVRDTGVLRVQIFRLEGPRIQPVPQPSRCDAGIGALVVIAHVVIRTSTSGIRPALEQRFGIVNRDAGHFHEHTDSGLHFSATTAFSGK